ncbi:MAG: threonine synthase [Planctomycetota bacterium]
MPGCGAKYGVDEVRTSCDVCGALLDIAYDWDALPVPKSLSDFERKWSRRNEPLERSGVWRFRELLPFAPDDKIVSIGEGQTPLHLSPAVAKFTGVKPDRLHLQYEGMNPSGSFKDNGMTAAFTHANMIGARRAACASTGNTSASLALYCCMSQLMQAVIFIGSGKISYGKLSQALDYGALTMQIAGDFDDAMLRVRQVSKELGIYLVNSVNPFRLEGQKTIMLRVLESLGWEPPDWVVVPGGNLGNSSSFAKAYHELQKLGLVDRVPRLAVVNAHGASTLNELYNHRGLRWNGGAPDTSIVDNYYAELDAAGAKADTIASAIEINRPVNLYKCLRGLECMHGVVRDVTEQEILDAKSQVAKNGLGCEPASAASVAGAKKLRAEGVIEATDRVVCVLTGHQLKDPTATVAYHTSDQKEFDRVLASRGVKTATYANRAVQVANDLDEIVRSIQLNS